MSWTLQDPTLDKGRIGSNGNEFLLSGGYMGCRDTMEEYTGDQRLACVLAGLYDQARDKWTEPINAPNGLLTRLYPRGTPLRPLTSDPQAPQQSLDMRRADPGRGGR